VTPHHTEPDLPTAPGTDDAALEAGSLDPKAGHFPSGPAIVGVLGVALVVLGASWPSSPFTSKVPGSWIFGIPAAGRPAGGPWLSLLFVYGGIVLLVSAWFSIVARSTRCSLRQLMAILIMWITPLLVSPPLFSRDVYTYGAAGQLVSAGINPYSHGLTARRSSVFFNLSDPLWRSAHAPYGPLFFDLAKTNARLMGHNVFGTLEGYRFLALLGLALMAVAVPVLARSYGQSERRAFSLAVLNPLVLIYLVGGMHNDAFMLGLLMAGVALASRNHPLAGILLCALATEVKVPAALGIVFIGWLWAGKDAAPLRRLRYVAQAGAWGAASVAVVSEVSGFGWGWLVDLSTPGTVVSWLDPATAIGLGVSHGLHFLGVAGSTHGVIVICRGAALGLATLVALALLVRSERYGLPRAMGWSLLAFVLLGPIVWPWYETWGIAFLAVAGDRWSRRSVVALSVIGCFASIPAHVSLSTHGLVLVIVILVALAGSALFVVVRTLDVHPSVLQR
jgi:alpha-1,6-mannosyltransferase